MSRSRALSSSGSGRRSTWSGWPAPTGASSSECRWGYCASSTAGRARGGAGQATAGAPPLQGPEYDLAPDHGAVLWRIDRGLPGDAARPRLGLPEDRGETDREPERAERRRRQAHGHRPRCRTSIRCSEAPAGSLRRPLHLPLHAAADPRDRHEGVPSLAGAAGPGAVGGGTAHGGRRQRLGGRRLTR